jgi:hypothetical protein
MTRIEKADILLDAIGMIGDDIIAESSGVSNILPIPSKIKLNLMVMRRLLAAAICLMIVSAITPLSVYLYNNYIAPAFQPSESTIEETTDTVAETEGENKLFEIPVDFSLDGFTSFDLVTLEAQAQKKVKLFVFALTHEANTSRALYIEVRSFDGKEITDTAFFEGHAIVLLGQMNIDELIIFNTALADGSSTVGYADVAKYSVIDGKLTKSEGTGIRHADFDLTNEASVDASRMPVFNMFMTLSNEIESNKNKYLIFDTYTSDSDRIHHPDEKISAPDITADRKEGKRTWSLERICELFGYSPPVITEKEPVPDVTLENGLVLRCIETEDGDVFYGVTGCSSETMTELRIPNEYNGIPITVLDTNVLSECRAETIIFPDSLTMFNKQKLGTDVKRVIIECNEDTYFTIGIFRGSMIKEAVFTGDITFMPNEIFYDCTELESVVFPETLTGIGEDAFRNCKSLREVNFPAGLRSIQEDAFISCSSLTSLVLPEGFESIGNSAFAGCVSVTEIVIPSTLKKIERNAFSGHSCEVITLPEGVEHLGGDAFTGSKLRFLYLPHSLTYFDHNFLFTDDLVIEKVYYNGRKDEFASHLVPVNANKNEYTIVFTDVSIRIEKYE